MSLTDSCEWRHSQYFFKGKVLKMNQRIYEEAFSAFFFPGLLHSEYPCIMYTPHKAEQKSRRDIHMQNYSGSFKECHMMCYQLLNSD